MLRRLTCVCSRAQLVKSHEQLFIVRKMSSVYVCLQCMCDDNVFVCALHTIYSMYACMYACYNCLSVCVCYNCLLSPIRTKALLLDRELLLRRTNTLTSGLCVCVGQVNLICLAFNHSLKWIQTTLFSLINENMYKRVCLCRM